MSHEVSKNNIVKGDEVDYTITLYNTNSLVYCPIKLKLESDKILFKHQFESPTIILYPKTEKKIVIPLQCNYRGYYRLGVESVIINDYFGLFSKHFKSLDTIKMIVYPKIKDLMYLPISNINMDKVDNLNEKSMQEQNNISYIREYEKGDTLNKIHWKLSSKYNELMVNQYTGEISSNVNIILDTNRHHYNNELNIVMEDKMIEITVMIINYLLIRNKSISFIFNDVKNVCIEGNDYNDFQRLYEECAILEFVRIFDFGRSLVDYCYKENTENFINSNQYIVISNINDEFIDSLQMLHIQKTKVTIIYVYVDNEKNIKQLEKLKYGDYNLICIPYDMDLDTLVGTSF